MIRTRRAASPAAAAAATSSRARSGSRRPCLCASPGVACTGSGAARRLDVAIPGRTGSWGAALATTCGAKLPWRRATRRGCDVGRTNGARSVARRSATGAARIAGPGDVTATRRESPPAADTRSCRSGRAGSEARAGAGTTAGTTSSTAGEGAGAGAGGGAGPGAAAGVGAATGSETDAATATATVGAVAAGSAAGAAVGCAGAAVGACTRAGAGAGVVVTAGAAVAAGSGADRGAGTVGAGTRAGRKWSGSTYPFGSESSRTPRCTYGVSTSASPLGPIVPTASPSCTASPFFGAVEPRWVRVTEYPSAVRIVSDSPLVGTVPANVTVPATGA
jgi:hypothetical protein